MDTSVFALWRSLCDHGCQLLWKSDPWLVSLCCVEFIRAVQADIDPSFIAIDRGAYEREKRVGLCCL